MNELILTSQELSSLLSTLLSRGIAFRFRVRGFSMWPFIKDNDIVTISPISDSLIGFGRSVAFIHPETRKIVIHRIVKKKDMYYLTKGDNSLEVDTSISHKDILGVISKIERNKRRVFFGLGMERYLIAFLSYKRLLIPVLKIWRMAVPFLMRRFIRWIIRM